jgi:hypothetical protein
MIKYVLSEATDMKTAFPFTIILSLIITSYAQMQNASIAVSGLCAGLQSLLPVAAMLIIILGAVIYAAGQMMGAETRARANVWATTCLCGAMLAILISVVSPSVLSVIYGPQMSCVSLVECLSGAADYKSAACEAAMCSFPECSYTAEPPNCYNPITALECNKGKAIFYGSVQFNPYSTEALNCGHEINEYYTDYSALCSH